MFFELFKSSKLPKLYNLRITLVGQKNNHDYFTETILHITEKSSQQLKECVRNSCMHNEQILLSDRIIWINNPVWYEEAWERISEDLNGTIFKRLSKLKVGGKTIFIGPKSLRSLYINLERLPDGNPKSR